jgi:uncharacterized protein
MTIEEKIEGYLAGGPYAVVGASRDRDKYGNKVLRAYQQRGLEVYPVNPKETEIEGQKVFADLAAIPTAIRGISIVTPPSISEQVVVDAAEAGVAFVWMQPGAESPKAIQEAEKLGMTVIADGSCILVALGYREG